MEVYNNLPFKCTEIYGILKYHTRMNNSYTKTHSTLNVLLLHIMHVRILIGEFKTLDVQSSA